MPTPGICLDLQEEGHNLPSLMKHHSAAVSLLVLPQGYVASGYTDSPLEAQPMGCIIFSIANPLVFWNADVLRKEQ